MGEPFPIPPHSPRLSAREAEDSGRIVLLHLTLPETWLYSMKGSRKMPSPVLETCIDRVPAKVIEEESMALKTYRCEGCGGDVTVDENAAVPECCGSAMAADPCVKAQSAENSRLEDADEACDDAVH
jgi:hypothetical protein